MKRHIVSFGSLCAVILALTIPGCRKSTDLKDARRQELSGNPAAAQALYASSALKASHGMKIPDVNHSKVFTPQIWRREIVKYVQWLEAAPEHVAPDLEVSVTGLRDCAGKTESANELKNLAVRSVTFDQYKSAWFASFFASPVPADSLQAPIARNAYGNNISLVKLSAASDNYSYQMSALATATGKRIDFMVLPGAATTILLSPGTYFLICRSEVTFSSGELWRSPYEAIALTLPESTSLISADLSTRVARKP